MLRVATCPSCMQPVTVPPGLDLDTQVRCPLCGDEYPLKDLPLESEEADPSTFLAQLEALHAGSSEEQSPDLPPELVPVPGVPFGLEGPLSDAQEESEYQLAEEEYQLAEDEYQLAEEEVQEEQSFVAPEQPLIQEGEGRDSQAFEGPALSAEEEEDIVFEEATSEEFASPAPGVEGGEGPDLIVEEEAQAWEGFPKPATEESQRGPLQESESVSEQTPEPEEYGLSVEEPGPFEEFVGSGMAQIASNGLSVEEPGPEAEPKAEGPGADIAEQLPAEISEEVSETEEHEAGAEAIAPLDLDPMVRSPFTPEPFPLSQLIVDAMGEPIGPAAAALIVRHGLLRPISEQEAAEMTLPEEALSRGALGEEPAEAFDFSTFSAQQEGAAPGVPISARPRKRAEVNPVKEMIGIVLGGAVGLLIGYYLLNMFGGARFDFLNVYLPGVKHTYKYAPAWLPEWAKVGVPSAGSEDPDQQEPSSKAKQNNRPSTSTPNTSQAESPSTLVGKEKGGSQKESGSPSTPQPPASTPQDKPSTKRTPSAKTSPRLELAGAPSYTPDDLGKALRDVLEVFGCKQCNSTGQVTKTVVEVQQINGQPKEISKPITVPCDACQGQPSKVITQETYPRFCHLAEVLCFVSGPEDQGQLADRKLGVRSLLERAAEEPANVEKIGPWAESLLEDAGRLSMGILLSGKLGRVQQQGSWQQYELGLAGTDRKVPLLVKTSPPAAEGDTVLVLGCVVEDPSDTLQGYSGSESPVVVGTLVVKVP